MERNRLIVLLLAVAGLGWGTASDTAYEGNELYKRGDYAGAAAKYEQARRLDPKQLGIDFNLGNAYYRAKDYKKAATAHQSVTASENAELAADAYYNMGNGRYREGEAGGPPQGVKADPKQTPPDSASAAQEQRLDRIQKWEGALEAYKAAIELLVKNESALSPQGKQRLADTRANYEFVRKRLKEQQQQQNQQNQQNQDQSQQQQQQQNQQQNQNKDQSQSQQQPQQKPNEPQDQQQKPQEGKDQKDQQPSQPQQQQGQGKPEEQKQPQKPEKPDQDKSDKDNQDKKDKQQPQPDSGQGQPQPQEGRPEPKMDKEEAERLLRQLRNEEEDQRKKRREKAKALAEPVVEKDW